MSRTYTYHGHHDTRARKRVARSEPVRPVETCRVCQERHSPKCNPLLDQELADAARLEVERDILEVEITEVER